LGGEVLRSPLKDGFVAQHFEYYLLLRAGMQPAQIRTWTLSREN
jgi:hypothetical protein